MLVRGVLIIIVRLQREKFNRNMVSSTYLIRREMRSRTGIVLNLLMMAMMKTKKVSNKIVIKMINRKKSLFRPSRKAKRR